MKNAFADPESSIDIACGEALPQVCVACGAPAEGVKTIVYERPNSVMESLVRIMTVLTVGRRNMIEENRQTYLFPLPVCDVHGKNDAALSDLAILPHRGRSVVLQPVSNDFIVALRAQRSAQASAFANQLSNVRPVDAKDFLKSLEKE